MSDVKGIIGMHRFRGGGTGGGTGGTCPTSPPPHFSPQSMKCPTSTGVHARPTMYQEGVPRGAIIFFFLYVKCPLNYSCAPPLQNMFRRLCTGSTFVLSLSCSGVKTPLLYVAAPRTGECPLDLRNSDNPRWGCAIWC